MITGGAGTGKSTILREITRNLEIREKSYCICAFTGKAVSRLHQVMNNSQATTIDRLILNIYKGISKCPSTIIIDEGSMVTTELFYRLLNSIENKLINFIIVGDCNQLPPIGWGNLMRELMNSFRIPLFYLTTNQRIITATSSEDRYILENANNLIDKNRNPRKPMVFNQGPGFYLVPGTIMVVNQIIKQLHQANYNLSDILILSPYKSYLDTLNVMVQETYLKDSFQYRQNIITGTRLWCVGDRVMMTKNNYEIGVMNGEEGYVDGITTEGVNVNFKETLYTFKFNSDKQEDKEETPEDAKESAKSKEDKDEEEELLSSDLIHSFDISVHKSQGSETNYVILFIPDDRDFNNFLNIRKYRCKHYFIT
jgi:exodeoxyribonuclease V alpha subunit